MSKFKVGDQVVVKYNLEFIQWSVIRYDETLKRYYGQVGIVKDVLKLARFANIQVKFNDHKMPISDCNLLPFDGFKIGDIVQAIDKPHLFGNIYKFNDKRNEFIVQTKELGFFMGNETRLKYHRSHFEKDVYPGHDNVLTRKNVINCEKSNDPINPTHNKFGKFQVWDIIQEVVKDLPGDEATCVANILKYYMRYPRKNGLQDVQKGNWYGQELERILFNKLDNKGK